MEITITWTQVFVLLYTYFAYRYLAGCLKKIMAGADAPFNPLVPYEDVRHYRAWLKGYSYGRKKLSTQYLGDLKKIEEEHQKLQKALDPLRKLWQAKAPAKAPRQPKV